MYDEHGVRIYRSGPGAHLLDVENSIGRIRAVANMMLLYMHVASKMVSWALLHACTVLNILSKPKSRRPALADGTSPGSAYMMAFYDVSRLIAPLFSYAIDKTKNQPKDSRPTGELVIYLGLAPSVNAWVVAPIANINKTRLSSNLIVCPDPT